MEQYNPPHPGVFIQTTYLSELDIHPDTLAKHLHTTASFVSRLINGESKVSVDMALKLSTVLGRTPESWLQMQNDYDLWHAKQKFEPRAYEPLCIGDEIKIEIVNTHLQDETERIRNRQETNMPEFMQEFAEELRSTELPNETKLTKAQYIVSWSNILGSEHDNEHCLETLSIYPTSHLKIAFEWTLKHFAELDLGGNNKWYSATSTILKLLRSRTWNVNRENLLLQEYLKDTRWYEE